MELSLCFFLDYYATSKLNVNEASVVIKSIAEACIDSGCSLLGGETAEMPGHYIDNNFDLAGFSVGCVEENQIITSDNVSYPASIVGVDRITDIALLKSNYIGRALTFSDSSKVKIGDIVIFGKWSGTEVKIDGKEYSIMKESDIMGISKGKK